MNTYIRLESNFTNVSLTCEADGGLSYYWQRQNVNIPSDAIGVNSSVLTLIDLKLNDAGNYRCIAINDSGSTESKYATLTLKGTHTYMLIIICGINIRVIIHTV